MEGLGHHAGLGRDELHGRICRCSALGLLRRRLHARVERLSLFLTHRGLDQGRLGLPQEPDVLGHLVHQGGRGVGASEVGLVLLLKRGIAPLQTCVIGLHAGNLFVLRVRRRWCLRLRLALLGLSRCGSLRRRSGDLFVGHGSFSFGVVSRITDVFWFVLFIALLVGLCWVFGIEAPIGAYEVKD